MSHSHLFQVLFGWRFLPLTLYSCLFLRALETSLRCFLGHAHRARHEGSLFLFIVRTLCFSHMVLCFLGFHPNHLPCWTFNLLTLDEHLSSSSRELYFHLRTAAFAIQVHESSLHRIRHDDGFWHFRFPVRFQPPHAIFHPYRLLPVRPV